MKIYLAIHLPKQLANHPTILQIDIDPSELGNIYPIDEGLCGDARLALADLRQALEDIRQSPRERDSWVNDIIRNKAAWRAQVERRAADSDQGIRPQRVIQELQRNLPDDAILISDPGTPTPFVSAEYELRKPGRWAISPRAQGGLGYAIPGVVGARLAKPDAPIVGLCGDGSFAMSAGDLATITRMGGPTILILFNNGCYGWIKALQKLHHGGRYFSVDFTEPLNYRQIAEGFGLRVLDVHTPDEIGPAIQRALSHGAPCFIELVTPGEHELIPPVAEWQRVAKEVTHQN